MERRPYQVDINDDAERENAILLETSPFNYVYIGSDIIKFITVEQVIIYVCNNIRNDVPCSYAITERYIYLVDDKRIGKKLFIDTK